MAKSAAVVATMAVPASAITCNMGVGYGIKATGAGDVSLGGLSFSASADVDVALTGSCTAVDCAANNAANILAGGLSAVAEDQLDRCATLTTGFSANVAGNVIIVEGAFAGCSMNELGTAAADNESDIYDAMSTALTNANAEMPADKASVAFGGMKAYECDTDHCNGGDGAQNAACFNTANMGDAILDLAADAEYGSSATRTVGAAAAVVAVAAAFFF